MTIPRFPFRHQLLRLDPVLLHTGETGDVPERLVRDLLEWSCGRRDLRSAAEQYLDDDDFLRAARCLAALSPTSDDEIVWKALGKWAQWCTRLDEECRKIEDEATKLSNAGARPDAIVPEWLAKSRDLLQKFRAIQSIEGLLQVHPSEVKELRELIGLLEYEIEARRRSLHELAEQNRVQARTLGLAISQVIADLLMRSDLEAQLEGTLEALQQRTNRALREVNLNDLAEIQEALDRLARGEMIEVDRAPRRARPPSLPDFKPDHLSSLARKLLDELKPGARRDELNSAMPTWEWEARTLEARRDHCLAAYREKHHADRDLGEVLVAQAKLSLLGDKPLQARLYFTDAFRWSCLSQEGREWRQACATGLLLSILISYAAPARRGELSHRMELTRNMQRQLSVSLLPELERARLVPEIATTVLRLGRPAGFMLVQDRLWAYFERFPVVAAQFLTGLVVDLSTEAPEKDARPALELVMEVLRLFIPGLNAVASFPAELIKGIQMIAECVRGVAERTVLGEVVAAGLERGLQRSSRAPSAPFEFEVYRLVSKRMAPASDARFILEVAAAPGVRPLRDVRTYLELTGGSGEPADSLRQQTLVPRIDELTEIVLPLSITARGPLTYQVHLSQEWVDAEGVTRKVETTHVGKKVAATQRTFSVQIAAAPKGAANPYTVGGSIRSIDAIFGRDDDKKRIFGELVGETQDNTVLVLGERRIGKSTLLNAIEADPLFTRRYLIAKIDLQITRGAESPVSLLKDGLFGPIARKLPELAGTLPLFPANPSEGFQRWMNAVDQHLEASNRRMLVLLDEFDYLLVNDKLREQVLAALRAVILSVRRISFILCGVTGIVHQHTRSRADRLFKLGLEVMLSELSEEAAHELISKPAADFFEFTKAARDLIAREAARQPYIIQQICNILFPEVVRRGLSTAARTDVDEALAQVASRRIAFHDFGEAVPDGSDKSIVGALAAIQVGDHGVTVAELGRRLRIEGLDALAEGLDGRLHQLEREAPSVVERIESRYRIRVPLYARHLRLMQAEGSS